MLMNRAETVLINSSARAALQRWYEAPLLRRRGGRVVGADVLELGCGRGVGTELILDYFGAARVIAMDADPAMVSRAETRLQRFGDRVRIEVGDAADLPYAPETFDAVFDFAIIHHVDDWRQAVAEVVRVLRPGGRFFWRGGHGPRFAALVVPQAVRPPTARSLHRR